MRFCDSDANSVAAVHVFANDDGLVRVVAPAHAVFDLFVDYHVAFPAEPLLVSFERDGGVHFFERPAAFLAVFAVHLPVHAGGGRAWPGGKPGEVNGVRRVFLDEFHGVLELLFCLGRVSDDDVGADSEVWNFCSHGVDDVFECFDGVPAPHGLEHVVVAGLHGEVDELEDFRVFHSVYKFVEVFWDVAGVAHADAHFELARYLDNFLQKSCKVCFAVEAVAGGVLAGYPDFFAPVGDAFFDFFDDSLGWEAEEGAFDESGAAERARVKAAGADGHNADDRVYAHAWFEEFDGLGLCECVCLCVDEFVEFGDVVRVYQLRSRVNFFDGVDDAWGDAAGDGEFFVRIRFFNFLNFFEGLFVSFDGADVHYNHVCIFLVN